jgi:hypothetical protein
MPTLLQLSDWVKAELAKGKGHLHTNHPVIIEEEQQKKIENKPDSEGKRKTKIAWETNDPDCYSLFHKERERYFKFAGGNPVLATEAVIMALRVQRDEDIRRFVEVLAAAEEAARPSLADA